MGETKKYRYHRQENLMCNTMEKRNKGKNQSR